ncbi:MAG TPA: hypothetical protein DDW23_06355 [Planctomycetes bacterium]|nr:hypothetical protein [Planctomycetota bacterium]
MSTLEFKLPDIGEGVQEGEVTRWLVSVGTSVKEDDPVVEVMTDKATVEIPSPAAGKISQHLVGEGDVAQVGDTLFTIEVEGGGESAVEAPTGISSDPKSAEKSDDISVPVCPDAGEPADSPATRESSGSRVLAAPATRRLARELGVDLSALAGTGPKGRIKSSDVRSAASPPPTEEVVPAAATSATSPPVQHAAPDFPKVAGNREVEEIPFRGIRRKTAEAMVRSKFTAPHFSLIEEVDCTEMIAARATAKEAGERYGIKVTFMPYIMKATAVALQAYPQLNAELQEEAEVIIRKKFVNLGIAVDTPNGLVVPVVQDVHLKGILQISTELTAIASRAREGKLAPEDFKDSTFTISNAGAIGGVMATPIINFPEVAILGVHTMRRMPRCDGEEIVARDVMNLSVSIDHRVVDGADGARFLVRMRELLEDPSQMLL